MNMNFAASSRVRMGYGTGLAAMMACFSPDAALAEEALRGRDDIVVRGVRADDSYAPQKSTGASKADVPLLETPQSVSVVTREQIEDRNFFTVGEALQQVTGVTVMPFDGSNPDFRARGFVLDLVYDGIPSAFSSGIQEFDLSIYERIEILRGPSGLFRGSGSPGGVVNFVRKRGLPTFQVAGALSAGSWNNYRGELDVGGPIDAAGRLRVRAVASYHDRDFFADGASTQKKVGYAALDYDLTPTTTIGASYTYQRNEAHNPYTGQPAFADGSFLDYPRDFTVTADWNLFLDKTEEAAAEVEQSIGDWSIRVRALQRKQDKFYTDAFVSPGTGVDPVTLTARYNRRRSDSEFKKRGVDAYVTGPFQLLGREQQLTLGYTYEYRRNRAQFLNAPQVPGVSILDPQGLIPPTEPFASGSDNILEQDGFYGQLRLKPLEPLTVVLGGRISNYLTKSRNVAPSVPTAFATTLREKNEFTPSVGAVLHLTDNVTAYASYSGIFVPQSALRADGSVLEPRIGEQWEGGLKGRFLGGGLMASAAVFRTKDRNRALNDSAAPGFFLPAGKVDISGYEVELTGRPMPGLDINIGYTNLKTEYAVSAFPPGAVFDTFEPRHLFKAFARYEPDWAGGAFGSIGMTAQSKVIGAGVAGLREQGAYALINAQAGFRFTEQLRAFLSVNNLFDRRYYARIGSINTYNSFGDPRNLLFTIRARY